MRIYSRLFSAKMRDGVMPANECVRIVLLAEVPEAIGVLAPGFVAHWGRDEPSLHLAKTEQAFRSCLNRDTLPLALVAINGVEVLGTVALLLESVRGRPSLGPWLGALFVFPAHRRKGIGTALVEAAEWEAGRLRISSLYAGTESAVSLFTRRGWNPVDRVAESGEQLTIFRCEPHNSVA